MARTSRVVPTNRTRNTMRSGVMINALMTRAWALTVMVPSQMDTLAGSSGVYSGGRMSEELPNRSENAAIDSIFIMRHKMHIRPERARKNLITTL